MSEARICNQSRVGSRTPRDGRYRNGTQACRLRFGVSLVLVTEDNNA